MIRITSFNLNGFGFVNSNIPFQQYLESFDADIICFQEIKKTKSALRPEHINVPGWIASYSFANSNIYGVATYIRATMTHLIPRHLEENICVKDSLIGGGKLEGLNFMEQIEVNSESGRVLISDHGSFVLFNIYAPSLVDVVHHLETRLDEENAKSNKEYTKTLINLQSNKEHTKALFNYALRERVDNLIEMGRKVVVVGDLNITHKPIDTFNPDVQQEGEKQDMYNKQQFRRWLSDWLNGVTREGRRGKKKVIDTFRHFYPDKRDEYTRWNPTRRHVNKGSRLDYVLVCPRMLPFVKSTTHLTLMNLDSDHCPIKSEFFLNHPEDPRLTLFLENNFASLPASNLCSSNWPEFNRPNVVEAKEPSIVEKSIKKRGKKPKIQISPQKIFPPLKLKISKKQVKKKRIIERSFGLHPVQQMNLTFSAFKNASSRDPREEQ